MTDHEPAGPHVTTRKNGSQTWSAVGGERVIVWQDAGLGERINWKWIATRGDQVVGCGSDFRHRSQARHTAMVMFPPIDGGRTENVLAEVMTEVAIAEAPDEDVPKLILQGLQELGWMITPMPRKTRYPKEPEIGRI